MKLRRPTKDVPAIPPKTLKKLRALIKESPWRTASSERYKNSPHAYIIFFNGRRVWKFFAHKIRKFGVYGSWRGHRYKYLFVDKKVFWIDFPAVNMAESSTLDKVKD